MDVNTKQLKKNAFRVTKERGIAASRVRVPGGRMDAKYLSVLQDIAETYGNGTIHLTLRQGFEIPGIPFEDMDKVNAMLQPVIEGMGINQEEKGKGYSASGTRNIMACVGNSICPYGNYDTTAFARKVEKEIFPNDLHFKVCFTGCHNDCAKVRMHDFGIIGMTMPQLDPNRCISCGACIKRCKKKSVGALQAVNFRPVRNEETCLGCGECVLACPNAAWTRSQKKYYKLTIFGRTGKKNPRLGVDWIKWIDEESIIKIIKNTYAYVEKYIDPNAPGGKEHIGYIVDRTGFEEFKKWVDSSHRKTKPFAEYSSVKPLGDMQVKESRETALRDGLIDKLRSAGIEVITDEEEAQRVLDAANGEVTLQKRLSDLQKAERFIVEGLKSNRRNGHFLIELPSKVKRMVRNAMGRDFDSHVITIGGIRHGLKNHGVSGDKLSLRSIPIREEDAALIPYIMTAPDYVRKGSTLNNRDSVRFYKTLENGYVVVVEKEWANSATDLETINIWGELSDAVNVRKDPEQNVRNATIGRSDAAKIRKDAETAIKNDEKISLHKVFHGSGNDFERFDHSHMGEGEGAQAYGWGTSGLPISLQTKTRLL